MQPRLAIFFLRGVGGPLGVLLATLAVLLLAPSAQAGAVTAIGGACDVRDGGKVTCSDGPRGTGVAQAKLPEAVLAQRTFVRGLTDATRVNGSGGTACALRAGGKLSCWGQNLYSGPLRFTGTNEVVEPVEVPGVAGAVDLAVGDHACVVISGGELRCWGADDYGQASGQIPGGGLDVPLRTVLVPTKVDGIPAVADVAVTHSLTCIAAVDGSAWCWGTNTIDGRLGTGTTHGSDFRGGPLQVPGLTGVAEIAANGSKVCARRENGEVWCWGRFSWRAPAPIFPENVDRPFATPTKVAEVSDAVELAVGLSAACARTEAGHVRCWGDNSLGQLGALARRSEAGLEVRGLTDATALTDPGERPCALRVAGDVACWGSYASVVAADPAERETTTQTAVPARGIANAQDLGVGAAHWCVLLVGGTARCAGFDMAGPREERLGIDGLGAEASTSPELGTVSQAVTGKGHSCFLTAGQARCFGLGNTLDQPVQSWNTGGAGALGGIVELASGERHVCARTTAERVWCWGSNDEGQVGAAPPGSGPLSDAAQRPTLQVADIVAVGNRSCALRVGGEVVCWGAVSGPDAADSVAENVVPLPAPATGVEAFDGRTCATFASLPRACWGPVAPIYERMAQCTLQAGQVLCTGDGSSGMLGTGSERFTTSRSVPVIRTADAITVTVPTPEAPPTPAPLPITSPMAQVPPPIGGAGLPIGGAGPPVVPRKHVLRSAGARRNGSIVTFTLVLLRGDAACIGAVRATLKVGRRSTVKRGHLSPARNNTCTASLRLRLPKLRGSATVRWSAAGLGATVRVRR